MKTNWLNERWLEYRLGNVYVNIVLSVVNFLILSYNFIFKFYTDSMVVFGILFVMVYIPITIVVGYFHRTRQQEIDTTITHKVVLEAIKRVEDKL